MIEEPCEGNLQARFCEGERLNIFIQWTGEAELEGERYIYLISSLLDLNKFSI